MKIGIAVLCRSTSRRLPYKHLHEIHGRTVLGHIMDRVQRGSLGYPIVVATSTDTSDDAIARYCRRSGFDCFRGSLENVAERFLQCAEHYGWDYVVRINGDNLFADPDILRSMLAIAETDEYDFITNKPGQSFPYGISVEIARTSFYREALASFHSADHFEHVTLWFYENELAGKRHVCKNKLCPEAAGMQLALDTEDDLNRYKAMFDRMDRAPFTYTLPEIYRLATQQHNPSPWKGQYGPLLIAEIGGNHEGNFEVAKELAQKAIATGVDYVKFQLYQGNTLVSALESPDRNQHFKNFELSREQHLELAQMCAEAGVGYLASVWDLEMLEWIDPHLSVYKIGSGDLTAWSFLRSFASRGKPIILSTGLATLEEVIQAVAQIQAVDQRYCQPEWLCLLQCTSMYPIAESEANLRVMQTLGQTTGLAVGYSDHTEGGFALRTAAAMGAEVLEFHFTDSREGKTFRDHKVSLTSEEIKSLQDDLERIRTVRGTHIKVPQKTEIEQGHVASFRRGTYLQTAAAQGQKITTQDIITLRPNHGIDARDADLLSGAIARKDIKPYQKLRWEDFEIPKGVQDIDTK